MTTTTIEAPIDQEEWRVAAANLVAMRRQALTARGPLADYAKEALDAACERFRDEFYPECDAVSVCLGMIYVECSQRPGGFLRLQVQA